MAQQQIQFAETIRAMKLAMRRRADDADSDDFILANTNRGNKLKRKSEFVRRGRLEHSGGLAYKKKIDHAGYTRNIISVNPPLFDEDGDRFSPDPWDRDFEPYAEPLEENAFGDVQLETLLRPLTSVAELPVHPSLSVAYKSKALTQMADDAFNMLRRERASLWRAKRVLQRFRGDADWVPCSVFETEHDELLLDAEGIIDAKAGAASSLTADLSLQDPENDGTVVQNEVDGKANQDQQGAEFEATTTGDAVEGVDAVDMAAVSSRREDKAEEDMMAKEMGTVESDKLASLSNGQYQNAGSNDDVLAAAETDPASEHQAPKLEKETTSETASTTNGNNMHGMTTRARARSPADRTDLSPSPSPSDSASVPTIHPWFLAPTSCLIDRDLGLPGAEAEETRRLLLLYVQKQEQIVRALDTLSSGLHKADRLRRFVHSSCKAEGHLVPDGKGNMVTEMSDGEDWYDVADWNLQSWELRDGKLEKGKDEVEDVEEEGRRGGRRRRVNRM